MGEPHGTSSYIESYREWVDSQDSYPEHNHKWLVAFYSAATERYPEFLHRNFGPFETQLEAKAWASEYRKKYVEKGFLSRTMIYPLCEVIPHEAL